MQIIEIHVKQSLAFEVTQVQLQAIAEINQYVSTVQKNITTFLTLD